MKIRVARVSPAPSAETLRADAGVAKVRDSVRQYREAVGPFDASVAGLQAHLAKQFSSVEPGATSGVRYYWDIDPSTAQPVLVCVEQRSLLVKDGNGADPVEVRTETTMALA